MSISKESFPTFLIAVPRNIRFEERRSLRRKLELLTCQIILSVSWFESAPETNKHVTKLAGAGVPTAKSNRIRSPSEHGQNLELMRWTSGGSGGSREKLKLRGHDPNSTTDHNHRRCISALSDARLKALLL
ncbi:hypothetical protein SCHPADRAFT_586701 [Schizopora paradoxa]|uniref:Uncharacterized protein n=1 Tax=Schizopora paradoxa TaxID=27342 RepID=A0A0H2RHL9_9AGAM|nr:hypothetical protein SCHPADRAFT_586701 [Schizopora paradoxa]